MPAPVSDGHDSGARSPRARTATLGDPRDAPWYAGLFDSTGSAPSAAPSASRSSPARTSSPSLEAARPTARAVVQQLDKSIVAFWIGGRCFGLETEVIGEVVRIEAVTPVPKAPVGVLGLFNLRGIPVAVVDLDTILDLKTRTNGASALRADEGAISALVLKTDRIIAAATIERVELVIARGRGGFTPPQGGDHRAVRGFVETDERSGLVVTLLDATTLLARLDRLKFE
jgi:chemotaxis signal transduction protein